MLPALISEPPAATCNASPSAIVPSFISVPASRSAPLLVNTVPAAIELTPVSVHAAPLATETSLKLVNDVPRPVSVPAPASAASTKVPPAPSTVTDKGGAGLYDQRVGR